MDKRHTEYLFELLDQKYTGDEYFWQKLHALDNALDLDCGRQCIRTEVFERKTAHSASREAFGEGEKTVVIRLKTQEVADTGAHLLNEVFKGSGVRFVAENIRQNGEFIHNLRTNMDKSQWAKLAIIAKYRFSREIKESERSKLQSECQNVVSKYVADHPIAYNREWKATEGMTAITSLLGLHGILRPDGQYKADKHRKHEELNGQNPYGTPLLFRDVPIHVDIDKHGSIKVLPDKDTPYVIGFNPEQAALEKAVDGGSLLDLVREAWGTNFYSPRLRIANKVLRGAVAVVSIRALAKGEPEPIIIVGIATAGLMAGYIHNRWRIIGDLKKLHKAPELLRDAVGDQPVAINTDIEKAQADHKIAEAEKRAFSSKGLAQLEEVLRDAGVAENIAGLSPRRTDDVLAARVAGSMSGLFR